MLFISKEDLKSRIIPDVWLWPLFLSGLFAFGTEAEHITAAILGYAIGFALFALTSKKQAIGFGDVKLLSVAGLWLGINGLSIATVSACALGIAYGLIKKQRSVPFAPFLFIGAIGHHLIGLIINNL